MTLLLPQTLSSFISVTLMVVRSAPALMPPLHSYLPAPISSCLHRSGGFTGTRLPQCASTLTTPAVAARSFVLFAAARDGASSSSSSTDSESSISANVNAANNVDHDITALMAQHDPILLYASRLLPPSVAADASALYAWCRRLDEIVDGPGSDDPIRVGGKLDEWEGRFDDLWNGEPVDAMDAALAGTIRRRSGQGLGREPFVDMIGGMRADVVVGRRVETRADLEEYAYQVAGTVGLMLLPLLLGGGDGSNDADDADDSTKAKVDRARGPAVSLGKAIQLINILRDAGPDAALGRIYLPRDELRAAGVDEDDVLALRSSPGYCRVVRSVSERAGELLAEAEAGRGTLPGPLGPLFVQVIVELYRGYLVRLEAMGYDNLSSTGGERVRIGTGEKVTSTLLAVREVLFSG